MKRRYLRGRSSIVIRNTEINRLIYTLDEFITLVFFSCHLPLLTPLSSAISPAACKPNLHDALSPTPRDRWNNYFGRPRTLWRLQGHCVKNHRTSWHAHDRIWRLQSILAFAHNSWPRHTPINGRWRRNSTLTPSHAQRSLSKRLPGSRHGFRQRGELWRKL